MLDRKTNNWEAGVELLKDREKFNWYMSIVFFCVGWFLTLFGALVVPYAYDDCFMGVGIAVLVIGIYFIIFNQGISIHLRMVIKQETKK